HRKVRLRNRALTRRPRKAGRHDVTQDLWSPIWLTIQLAGITTLALLIIGIPIAWWLAWTPSRWREVIATILALPLVLPPTVLGVYIIVALGPQGLGGWLRPLVGLRTFTFSFEGLVARPLIASLPFIVQLVRNSFEGLGRRPLE